MPHGEVVELVYGTSLENWRAFVAYRGFESHPLRQHYMSIVNSNTLFNTIWSSTQAGEGESLLNF